MRAEQKELDRLTYKLLRQVRDLAVKYDFDGYELDRLGFVKRGTDTNYSFYNVKLGVLIKFPYLTTRKLPSMHCIPTVITKGPGWSIKLAVIQPIADLKNSDKAFRLLKKMGVDLEVVDFHKYNVGWFRGKPVIFDW